MAACVVVTGGCRLGMTIALPKQRAVWTTTLRSTAPSRRGKCQSSGLVIVSVVICASFVQKLPQTPVQAEPHRLRVKDHVPVAIERKKVRPRNERRKFSPLLEIHQRVTAAMHHQGWTLDSRTQIHDVNGVVAAQVR